MIGLVSAEGRARAEQARLVREGLVPQAAPAVAEKRRKKREREDRAQMPGSDAHAAAEGATGHVTDESSTPDLGKGFQHLGVSDCPDRPMMPGMPDPGDFTRPLITDGHEAASPGQGPPNTPYLDLRGDRGMVRSVNPLAPAAPVEGPAR